MNDGLFNGFGSGTPTVRTPCVWQVFETTTSRVPFPSNAKYLSYFGAGGGGGGGSGRYDSVNAASGGGGGGSSNLFWERRLPVQMLRMFGVNRFEIVIGAGGTAGAASTTNGVNGNAGGAGGQTTIRFYDDVVRAGTSNLDNYHLIAAPGGSGGSGGTTTTAGGGAAGSLFANAIASGGGSTGRTSASDEARPQSGQYGPVGRAFVGGNGGTGKNNVQAFIVSLGRHANAGTSSVPSAGYGTNGFPATYWGQSLFNMLIALPYFPDFAEFSNYLWGSGGGGTGGQTSVSGAAGSGGDGWRGTGGGGGGGNATSPSGAGGAGGNGFVVMCWEFQ